MINDNNLQFPRPATGKSPNELTIEWDQIAHIRQQQIASGRDLSYRRVLLPAINDLLKGCHLERVLDIGCGTGQLTADLAGIAANVTAVDSSSCSIKIAQETCKGLTNTSFHVTRVEDFADKRHDLLFTTAVANMSLMTCLNLESFVIAVSKLLVPTGHFIGSITHPFFWPYHHKYADAEWFSYEKEIPIEAPFRISTESTSYVTTHIHRPLASYFNSLLKAGFVVDNILEPFPNSNVQALYPEHWEFPRFLIFRAILTT